MRSKRNKALKWIIPAASAAAVTLTAGSLVRMGLHFMGPLRHLAVDKIKIRYGYVGFNFNEYGKLTFGRLEDAFYKVSKVTDIFWNWGTSV